MKLTNEWQINIINGSCGLYISHNSQTNGEYVFHDGKKLTYDSTNYSVDWYLTSGDILKLPFSIDIPSSVQIKLLEDLVDKISVKNGEICLD